MGKNELYKESDKVNKAEKIEKITQEWNEMNWNVCWLWIIWEHKVEMLANLNGGIGD